MSFDDHWYPLVMTNSLRTWSHGPVEIVEITNWKWWIFPVRYVNVYQRVNDAISSCDRFLHSTIFLDFSSGAMRHAWIPIPCVSSGEALPMFSGYVPIFLTDAKRREWMGCWGLLGWLRVSQWIIPKNSLRLAQISFYIAIENGHRNSWFTH